MENATAQPASKPIPRFVWMGILTVILLTFVSFFLENTAYFDSLSRVSLSDVEYAFSFIGAVMTEAVYVFCVKKFFHVEWHRKILIFFSLFFVVGSVAIFTFPGTYENGTLIYALDNVMKARYLGNLAIEMFGVYLVFAIVPQVLRGSFGFRLFFDLYALFMVGAVIYSYVTEAGIYATLFATGNVNMVSALPKSFTTQRNVYGMMLFLAVVGEAYLISCRPQGWRWFFILFFYANEFFIISKTALIAATFFIAAFFLYRVFSSFRRHPIRNAIIVLSILSVLGMAIALTLTGLTAQFLPRTDLFFHSLWNKVMTSAENSMQARYVIWSSVIDELFKNPITALFGFGEDNFQMVLNAIHHLSPGTFPYPLDSSYVTLMAKFGLIGLGLYVVALGYLAYLVVLAIIHQSRRGFYYLLTLLTLCVIGFAETHLFVGFSSQSVMLFLAFVLPLVNETHLYRRQEKRANGDDIAQKDSSTNALWAGTSDVIKGWCFILLPLFMVLFVVCLSLDQISGGGYANRLYLAAIGLFYFLLPLLFGGIFRFWHRRSPLFLVVCFLTIVYLTMMTFAPFVYGDNFFVGIGMGVGLAAFLIVSFGRGTPGINETAKLIWPYFLTFSVFALLLMTTKYLFHVVITPHLLVVFAADAVLIWLLLFVGIKKEKLPDRCCACLWDRIESFATRCASRQASRDIRYWERQNKLVHFNGVSK